MAKEVKKGKTAAAKKTTTVAKKTTPAVKKTKKVAPAATRRSKEDIKRDRVFKGAYVLLMGLGVALIMVSFIMRLTGYIGTKVMLISIVLAFVFIVTALFISKEDK